jgi:alkanesulfonate monooxygenase SsuD/methylene tetrahydromethanopterin reductase-like flavin-dependent oxidoreductase (luciferase family)
VKFGINYNTGVVGVDPDAMIAIARHAEACGFESFYVPEHSPCTRARASAR